MSDSQELDDQLYNLLLMGLYRRLESATGQSFTTAYPVVAALTQVTCYRDLVSRKWTNRPGLIERVQQHAKEARRAKYATATRLEVADELAAVAGEHIVILVCPPHKRPNLTAFDHSRVLGKGGYQLLLTAAGVAAAITVAESYPLLDAQQYMAGQTRFNALKPHERRNI